MAKPRCLSRIFAMLFLAYLTAALPTAANSTAMTTTVTSPSATSTPIPSPVYLLINPAATPAGPPDYDALVPADPATTPRATADLAEHGLRQTTYYSCATYATTTHCGWHRPLIPVAASSGAEKTAGVGSVAMVAAASIAALLAVGFPGIECFFRRT
ncbi:predicted protein [Verticillium alfalfae VaMs.102]|uniref:Predicted protein n=1 Tax=Verticillium alfalfae (strain VaMs.102 / ATCC MYA-4576 / FGSC 10136) TaxID=526221 RepID=C9S9H1_VERA1|nr:predicted protein [Verticillium alfalfae VaMs.102]EEY16034.1 predicted protein [Verticillium alfalfae VaMs.102]